MMINLIRKLCSANHAERVPDRLVRRGRRIGRDRDSRRNRPRADVIPERQPALPRLWNALCRARSRSSSVALPYEIGTTGMCETPACASGIASRTCSARRPGRCRIAGAVEHAATLYPLGRSHGPGRIDVASHEPVILRIAVDEQRERAVSFCLTRLDPAKRAAVAGHRDLPADRHA